MHPTTQYPADNLTEGAVSFLSEALSQMPTALPTIQGKTLDMEISKLFCICWECPGHGKLVAAFLLQPAADLKEDEEPPETSYQLAVRVSD